MSSKRETPYYLIPGTFSIELEECAHLHRSGGIFLSQKANDFLRSASFEERSRFFHFITDQGCDEDRALRLLGCGAEKAK